MANFESFRAIAVISLPVIGTKLAVGPFDIYAPNIYHLGISIFFFTQVMMNDKNEA